MNAPSEASTKQSDTLLWLAGALVAGMGVTWLVLAKPWSDGNAGRDAAPFETVAAPAPAPASAQRGTPRPDMQTDAGASLEDNPMRMARLAHEAGMLVEPEDYSAWSLYQRALRNDPDNAEAHAGLEQIAAELVRRAEAAMEQGRFGDVRATIERIRAAIPVHTGANDLEIRLAELIPRTPREVPQVAEELESDPAAAEQDGEPEAETQTAAIDPDAADDEAQPAGAPGRQTDPVAEGHAAFLAAVEQNRLLTPVDQSARHFVDLLTLVARDHELTRAARSRLFEEFLARAETALGTRDTDAAETWIEEAERLAVDEQAVAGVRALLRGQLIDIESAKRLPASALTVAEYTAPVYPVRALERELHGWVDLEFTVDREGRTRDVTVTDASHNSYFRDEAQRAVEAWRFEPKVFLGETIEQRAYTRIRFEFE